ncbi:CLUMA_CG014128, isoform A [Clunio marinus]|uniref:CLUMA_CG014128, isoform A n=1 Tax=Clunio marinus TaxID=568069 RepID=A0A1J1IKW5_9DIPT|nr:CLUMA_CG014128, isoform A [Clunio marinus]
MRSELFFITRYFDIVETLRFILLFFVASDERFREQLYDINKLNQTGKDCIWLLNAEKEMTRHESFLKLYLQLLFNEYFLKLKLLEHSDTFNASPSQDFFNYFSTKHSDTFNASPSQDFFRISENCVFASERIFLF